MEHTEILSAFAKYRFYHRIKLTDEITTPGDPLYEPVQELCMKLLRAVDLKGKRVLDIGCRDGLFSFAAEAAGVKEVIGIDNDVSKPATEFLIPFLRSKVRMHEMNLYDLTPDMFGLFDVIIFPGVLYHLRYPFWGLKRIREVMKDGGSLIVETAITTEAPNAAVLYCPTGRQSPYEASSCTFFNPKGLSDTLESLGFRTEETARLTPPKRRGVLSRILRRVVPSMAQIAGKPQVDFHGSIDRFALRCVYSGFATDSVLGSYWEGTHNVHTEHGGSQNMEDPYKIIEKQ